MRNYIILNGVNSNTITGLLISTLPPITKPKIRTQTEEIDGRDGDIVTKLGYSAYDKEIEIGLYGNFDINEVIAYFNTEGTVVFSNEADKYYNYQILDQIDYEKLIRFKTAKVKMHVQPFKYPLEETPVEINIQNVTSEAETVDLDNTTEAPLTLALKGNTSQDGTPTPEAPVEVKTVTGNQEINIVGKNLLKLKNSSNVSQGVTITINDNRVSFIGTPTRAYVGSANMPLYLKKGTYTFSSTNGVNSFFLWFKNQSGNVFSSVAIRPNPSTVTLNEDATAIQIGLEGLTVGTACNVESYFQLEKGNTASEFEPYKEQSYEINLGKNLFDKSKANLNKGVATGNGGLYNSDINFSTDYIEVNSNGTYYTASGVSSVANRVYGAQYDSNKQYVGAISTNAGTRTFYISDTSVKYIRLTGLLEEIDTYQVERGSETTSYAPYKTPIELCKIGDYQDYIYKDNNKWFIKRQIGKLVLDGTQNITLAGGTPRRFNATYTTLGIDNIKSGANATETQENYRMCDYFSYTSGQTTWGNYYLHNNWLVILDGESVISDANALKAWLSNNNTSIYYVLETPEDEEITDNTLIGQLNALENARSYDTTTHINQNTPNKPFIINATAVQKGSDTGNVDNIGNIYAKPTIDIEGSGIVEIYLDGNQIFNVDLSTINECVIDTTNLEAYNPATTQLMNRQVTGDYSNFKINVGDNQVKVSGAVTKATISNYTRWL